MKRVLALLILIGTSTLSAQETLYPANLAGVDVVVIGTLYSDFKFPWFDGWNERGTFRWNMFSEARREP